MRHHHKKILNNYIDLWLIPLAHIIGKVCTSRDVEPCSSIANNCESFKSPADKAFAEMFPKAYAKVCVEPTSGEQCLYTDITYETCPEARISESDYCIFQLVEYILLRYTNFCCHT